MSTVEAIRFRHLAAQLTPIETKQFICKLFNLNGNIFMSALFHYITQLQPNCRNDIHTIKDLISNIILSRKKTPKAISNINLNELPSPLIGATASFLNQDEYVHLSACSRSLFIGCNRPNQLQRLDLLDIRDYSNINLSHFPFIKALNINTNRMMASLHFHGTPNFELNELQSITLDVAGNSENFIDIHKLREHVPLHTNRITHLALGNTPSHYEHQASVAKLLNNFENIFYLRFHRCGDNNPFVPIPLLPKLRGLAITNTWDVHAIPLIRRFSHQLESLELEQFSPDSDLNGIQLPKLEELVLYNPSYNTIRDITKTAVKLRQIDIDPTNVADEDTQDMTMTIPELKNGIQNVIETCKHLQHFAINGYGESFVATLEAIETAILHTLERKRISMRIVIWMAGVDDSVVLTHTILSLIERIVIGMEQSNTTHFMLALAESNSPSFWKATDKIKAISNGFKTISKNANISIRYNEVGMCITNKQCSIVGCDPFWKLHLLW
eukprot:22825_1